MLWPPMSMTARVVARNARRLSRSPSEVKPRQIAPMSAPGFQPTFCAPRPSASTRWRTGAEATTLEHLLGAGQGGGAQDEVDLPAEAAARDEDEAVHPVGEEVVELHRDAAAERVPDEGDPLDAEVVEQVAQGRGVRAERVVARRLGRLAVPEQVGHDDAVVVVDLVDEVGPLALRAEDAVDEEHDGAGAAVDVRQLVAVEGDRVRGQAGHGCHPRRGGRGRSVGPP